MTSVCGKVALITGAASGIGFKFAEYLLKYCAKGVVISDVNATALCEAQEKLEKVYGCNKSVAMLCDVTDDRDFNNLFQETITHFEQLDIVINNAGIFNDHCWKDTIDINLGGVIRGTYLGMDKYLPKYMSGDESYIVNVSSTFGLEPFSCLPVYASSKHAVIGLTRSYGTQNHYARTAVKVIAICPGVTDTPLIKDIDKKCSTYKEIFENNFEKYPKQNVDCVGEALIKVLDEGETGSVWVAEANQPAYEIIFPDRQSLKKSTIEKKEVNDLSALTQNSLDICEELSENSSYYIENLNDNVAINEKEIKKLDFCNINKQNKSGTKTNNKCNSLPEDYYKDNICMMEVLPKQDGSNFDVKPINLGITNEAESVGNAEIYELENAEIKQKIADIMEKKINDIKQTNIIKERDPQDYKFDADDYGIPLTTYETCDNIISHQPVLSEILNASVDDKRIQEAEKHDNLIHDIACASQKKDKNDDIEVYDYESPPKIKMPKIIESYNKRPINKNINFEEDKKYYKKQSHHIANSLDGYKDNQTIYNNITNNSKSKFKIKIPSRNIENKNVKYDHRVICKKYKSKIPLSKEISKTDRRKVLNKITDISHNSELKRINIFQNKVMELMVHHNVLKHSLNQRKTENANALKPESMTEKDKSNAVIQANADKIMERDVLMERYNICSARPCTNRLNIEQPTKNKKSRNVNETSKTFLGGLEKK